MPTGFKRSSLDAAMDVGGGNGVSDQVTSQRLDEMKEAFQAVSLKNGELQAEITSLRASIITPKVEPPFRMPKVIAGVGIDVQQNDRQIKVTNTGVAGEGTSIQVVKITGLHSDSPASGERVYLGDLYTQGWYLGEEEAGTITTDVTIMIPGIADDIEAPSYGTWAATAAFLARGITYTWVGAEETHTDEAVYEAYPGQLML